MRKAPVPVIAGKPPAEGAHAPGINGRMVTVDTNEAQEPAAARIPAVLFQNPRNKSTPNSHSETPRK
jgi:hypothetical protein